ncbi:Hypothetical protein A7982_05449 [Minicystis rosea]|nr:Hypothetical protein A7982_05449 [Minicystis rosea]
MSEDSAVAGIDTPPVEEERRRRDDDDAPASQPPPRFVWKTNLVLFLATVVSVFYTGLGWNEHAPKGGTVLDTLKALPQGWPFALPLLAILLTHELAHYVAARAHNVEASLPYFIPLPYLSPFGTAGAVIAMPGRIRSRNALLDIGASGPLAGLCVAIPVLIAGLMQSKVEPMRPGGWQEGQCLLYLALKRIILGPIPEGYDVFLTPMALAGWAGLLVTMLNLIAVAQLDGGHIAYALFGPRQNRYARALHAMLLVVFAFNLARFLGPVLVHRAWGEVKTAISNSIPCLVWYVLIALVKRAGGDDHPPTEPGELSPVRKVVAVVSLVLFVLLFMPTPYTSN